VTGPAPQFLNRIAGASFLPNDLPQAIRYARAIEVRVPSYQYGVSASPGEQSVRFSVLSSSKINRISLLGAARRVRYVVLERRLTNGLPFASDQGLLRSLTKT
jgi:hypothetical protein